MQYALLYYSAGFAELPAAVRQDYMDQMTAWRNAAHEAGVLRGGLRLAPVSSATSVRRDGDELLITDGPFAETKEMLGGFTLLECPDLDAALAWAKRCPLARAGTVEVRPQHPDSR